MDQAIFERVLEVSRHMAQTRTLEPLLEYVMKEAIDLVGAERGFLVLVSEGDALDFRMTLDHEGKQIVTPRDQISTSILQKTVQDGAPLILVDALSDPEYAGRASVSALQLRSVMCVPLITRGSVIGAVYVENRSNAGVFKEGEDLPPLVIFANQAAVCIENAIFNDGLEELVKVRTQELQKEIEEREKLITDLDAFSHMVAHDLKNPLNGIIGYTEMVLEGGKEALDEKFVHYLEEALRNSRRMGNIISEILTLAGVRRQRATIYPLNMGTIVKEVESRLGYMIEQRSPVIVQPEKWPEALGHAPWVEEVWANYISNAIKYGGNPPHVTLGADPPKERKVRFWVADDGPGLTPEEQARLFTDFEQLGKRSFEGHGLGLSITRRIVEKLGGEVGVESTPGKGSRFWFTLPSAEMPI